VAVVISLSILTTITNNPLMQSYFCAVIKSLHDTQMNLRSLLTGFLTIGALCAQAQGNWVTDSVTMGPGYGADAFYSLRNGNIKAQPNTDWHLAFQMTPPGPYGNVSALANHVQGGVKVYSLHMKASNNFDALSAVDTVGKTSQQLYNSDTSWNFGAFNQMNNPTNVYDYSWGTYDNVTHNVTGDSLYLIKVGTTNTPYKVWIKEYISNPYDSIKWVFRIAQFDGTGDTTVTIRPKDFVSRLFAYYNVDNKVTTDREPDRNAWDFVFTRYVDTASQGPITMPYNTTGVLSNFGLLVAEVRGANSADTTNFHSHTFINHMNAIGYDWKVFDMAATPPVYRTDTNINYFIKTATTNEYYQLEFTRFDGASTGKVVFRKRVLAPTSIAGVAANNIAAWHMAPNPATDNVSVMIDAKNTATDAKLIVMDASGKMVQQLSVPLQNGMNGYSFSTSMLPSGIYFVRLGTSTWNVATRLVVTH
jgi:hypothetical protein